MIKEILQYLCYKVYEAGRFEAQSRELGRKNAELKGKVLFRDLELLTEARIHYAQTLGNKISIGKATTIKGELLVSKHGGEIVIGDYCYVGTDTKIWSSKRILVGDRVLIAHNVNIHDNISHSLNAAERHAEYRNILESGTYSENIKTAEIIINDDVWIGFNSTILKGVEIGLGSIIGANTVVTRNVPAYSIVVGNPMRIIGRAT
jgi:acetyltransferase-like isoleucine patch superfamily enzyme